MDETTQKIKKPNEQTDLERRNLVSKSCNKPKNFSWSIVKEKSMSLLDVQHIKNLQNPLSRDAGRSPSDIHFTVKRVNTSPSWGIRVREIDLQYPSHADQPTEGRVYLNGTDTSTIKNKDASSFRREN